jgi:hypothetical protein
LNFFRDGSLTLENNGNNQLAEILAEARYYQARGLIQYLEVMQKKSREIGEKEVIQPIFLLVCFSRPHFINKLFFFFAQPSAEKQYKLMTDVNSQDLSSVFEKMTIEEEYDFESWVPAPNGKIHMLFTKKLSKGDVAFLERLGLTNGF